MSTVLSLSELSERLSTLKVAIANAQRAISQVYALESAADDAENSAYTWPIDDAANEVLAQVNQLNNIVHDQLNSIEYCYQTIVKTGRGISPRLIFSTGRTGMYCHVGGPYGYCDMPTPAAGSKYDITISGPNEEAVLHDIPYSSMLTSPDAYMLDFRHLSDIGADTGWECGTGWNRSGAILSANAATGEVVLNSASGINPIYGIVYRIQYEIDNWFAGDLTAKVKNDGGSASGSTWNADGVYVEYLQLPINDVNPRFEFATGGGFTGDLKNIYIYPIIHEFITDGMCGDDNTHHRYAWEADGGILPHDNISYVLDDCFRFNGVAAGHYLYQPEAMLAYPFTDRYMYRVEFTVANYAGGTIVPFIGTGFGPLIRANGVYAVDIIASDPDPSDFTFGFEVRELATLDIQYVRVYYMGADGTVGNPQLTLVYRT